MISVDGNVLIVDPIHQDNTRGLSSSLESNC